MDVVRLDAVALDTPGVVMARFHVEPGVQTMAVRAVSGQ